MLAVRNLADADVYFFKLLSECLNSRQILDFEHPVSDLQWFS